MTPRGACEGCGRVRALHPIDSGQQLCARCRREIRPPQLKHLVTWATIEKWHRDGIEIQRSMTRTDEKRLVEDIWHLEQLLATVRWIIAGAGFRAADADPAAVRRAAYRLWLTPAGQRLVMLERERTRSGRAQYQVIVEACARGELAGKYEVIDACLYECDGGERAYYHFKPPLRRDADFDAAVRVLRDADLL